MRIVNGQRLPWWRNFSSSLLDFIYPPSCELCSTAISNGRYLCENCVNALPRIKAPFCDHCGEMFEGHIESNFICPNCSKLDYAFSFARPVLLSSDHARTIIHDFKYRRSIHLARDLATILCEAFEDPRLQLAREQKWTLVPVHLYWKRKQHRHFNQSQEIAKHVAQMLGLPLCDALTRLRATPTQTHLSRKQRLLNLKGAIQISRRGEAYFRENPSGGVILIDDVFTTGSTVQECAKTLRKNLCENIVVVTVMRG